MLSRASVLRCNRRPLRRTIAWTAVARCSVVSQLLAELDGLNTNADLFVLGATNRHAPQRPPHGLVTHTACYAPRVYGTALHRRTPPHAAAAAARRC